MLSFAEITSLLKKLTRCKSAFYISGIAAKASAFKNLFPQRHAHFI
jgi:hypothetical protein